MGQQLFKVNLERVNLTETDETTVVSRLTLSNNEKDDITFFYFNESNDIVRNDHQMAGSQIRDHLSQFTTTNELTEIDTELYKILTETVFPFVDKYYKEAIKEIKNTLERQVKLKRNLVSLLKEEESGKNLTFGSNDNFISNENNNDREKKQLNNKKLSYIAIESLISILLTLIKSAEKHDSAVVNQILSLADQLCEQIPAKYLLFFNQDKLLLKHLNPLVEYIEQLSLSSDSIVAKKTIKILLRFSIATGSFKGILPLLSKLVFDLSNTYDLKILFEQLNNCFTESVDQLEKQKQQKTSSLYLDQEKDNDSTSKESTGMEPIISFLP